MTTRSRLQVFQELVSRGPTDPFPYYCLAQEYRSLGRTAEALEAYATLRGRFPDYIPTYLMAAQVSLETGDTVGARVWGEKGVDAARAKRDHHALGELESFVAALGTP